MDDLDLIKSTVEGAKNLTSTYGEATTSVFEINNPPFPLIPINPDGQIQPRHHHIIDGLDNSDQPPPPPPPLSTKRWSIFKVPRHLREGNVRGYEPRIVSIGPFHCKKWELEPMEAQKLRFVNHLMKQGGGEYSTVIEDAMKELEEKTRGCYSEDFGDIDSDSFTRMMLVDGCFVVQLLRLSGTSYKGKLVDDPIFATRWMPLNLGRDLLLLENQLPLFVLQRIFDITTSAQEKTSLNNLALQFFEPLRPGKDMMPIKTLNAQEVYPHLLALFQSSCAPSPIGYDHDPSAPNKKKKKSNGCNTYTGKGWIYNVKWLHSAGVGFSSKSGNVLDIEYNYRLLKIPTLYMDENTITVLRNLVAYEQCDKCAEPYFTSHAFFFSNILSKAEDVAVLKKSGIIRQAQGIGDEEVVMFFDNLAKDLVFDMNKCCLANIIEDIQTYSQTRRAKWRSVVRTIMPRLKLVEFALFNISLVQTFLVISQYYSTSTVAATAPSPSPAPSPSG